MVTSDDDSRSDDDTRPALRIVRGEPSAEEIAVLTALVSAGGEGADAPVSRIRRGGWNDPAASHRRQLYAGPNGWRGSLR